MALKALIIPAAAIAVFTTGLSTLNTTAPYIGTKIDSVLRDYFIGWSEEACTKNPMGCLENRYATLSALETSAQASVNQMRMRLEQANSVASEQLLVAEKNKAFLDKGKELLKQSEAGNSKPIEFAGRTYNDSATFRTQLRLLFEEKLMLEQNHNAANDLARKIQKGLDALIIQKGRITLAKEMVPSQIELVRTNYVLSDLNKSLLMIDAVISGSEGTLESTGNLIRSTSELLAATNSASNAPNPPVEGGNEAFEQFLRH